MKKQIICENVELGYGGKAVCSDISFEVCEGDYLCIVGKNGVGKSTLIKAFLGLVQPIGGSIAFCGDMKKSHIGYLPQQTAVQRDFPATVYEIVLSGCCGFVTFHGKENKKKALSAMEKMGISDLKNKCYRDLSGGQQQRVLLARAFCAARKMIILDEPVSGLDPEAAEEMYEIINKLNREDSVTVIMISHDTLSVEYATHILHLDKNPLFFGKKEDYITSPASSLFIHKGEEI